MMPEKVHSPEIKSTTSAADVNLEQRTHETWEDFVHATSRQLEKEREKFDCVVHMAGGFVAGELDADPSTFEDNWKMNVRSAYMSAYLAKLLLKPNIGIFHRSL